VLPQEPKYLTHDLAGCSTVFKEIKGVRFFGGVCHVGGAVEGNEQRIVPMGVPRR